MAQFEETSIDIGSEGNFSIESDDWTEKASEHWFVKTSNGQITSEHGDWTTNNYVPSSTTPPAWSEMKRLKHFKQFSVTRKTKCEVQTLWGLIAVSCESYHSYAQLRQNEQNLWVKTHWDKAIEIHLGSEPP